VNWEIYKDPTAKIPFEIFEKMYSAKKRLQIGDVIYVRRGSYRIGSVAMISPYDLKIILTRELLVLRILDENNRYKINAFYLLYLLSHKLTQMQTFNKVLIETTLPNIGNRWTELMLPLNLNVDKRIDIARKVEKVLKNKWQAIGDIERLKLEFGELTT